MLSYKQYRMLCESRHTLGLKTPKSLGIKGAFSEAKPPMPFGDKGGPTPPMGDDMGMEDELGAGDELGMGGEEEGMGDVCPCCGQPMPEAPPEEEMGAEEEGGEDAPHAEDDTPMESKKAAPMTEADQAWWKSFNSMMNTNPEEKHWDGFTQIEGAGPGEVGYAPQQKL